MSVKIKVIKFIRKLGRNIDFLSVKYYYERNGWKIIYFTESSEVIIDLNLYEKAKTEKGFIYNENNIKYIFIKKGLSELDKRNVIFHEAGHIELNHEYSELSKDAKERQAQDFASFLISQSEKKPAFFNSMQLSIISVIVIVTALLVHHSSSGVALGFAKNFDTHSKVVTQNPSINFEKIADNEQEYFFVTPSGHKYHLPHCYYIRNNQNAFEINASSAKQSYSPCSICIYEQ